jgi:hypothetical protein
MMNSSNAQVFGAAHTTAYSLILSELGEEASRVAVNKAIKTLRWRPSPAELREMAAQLVSPLPSVGILWAEFWHKAIHTGYTVPGWTHPILSDLAAELGGWQGVRETSWPESHPAHVDALRSRFEAVYGTCSTAWRESVCEQLAFPRAERDPRYFPDYRPFVAPKSLPPGDAHETFPTLSEIEVDAPDDMKERIARLRKRSAS